VSYTHSNADFCSVLKIKLFFKVSEKLMSPAPDVGKELEHGIITDLVMYHLAWKQNQTSCSKSDAFCKIKENHKGLTDNNVFVCFSCRWSLPVW